MCLSCGTGSPRVSKPSWRGRYDRNPRFYQGLRAVRAPRGGRDRRRGERRARRRDPGRGRGIRPAGRVLARRGAAVRGRDLRLHRGVLAARVLLRPAHRPAHRAAGHRAGARLPRQDRRRRRIRRHSEGVIVATLEIRDLHVSVEESPGVHREILRGVNLTVREGETHAIMGPNGSGKSTLAYAIAGHPKYLVTRGSVTLDGEDVLAMTVDNRARAGLFLAMQYPVEVPGVSVSNFLRTAVTAVRGEAPKLRDFVKELRGAMSALAIDPAFAERNLNEGFSGGEKKRHEILQLELLKPKIAVLDETDSGLDVDALKIVSEGINRFRGV